MLVGWFTHVHGTVFVDSNGNGKRDPGEHPVPRFALTVRERDNSLMDQATNTATTDDNGIYDIRETYPLGQVARPRGVQHPVPDHRHHLQGRERGHGHDEARQRSSTSTSCRSSVSAAEIDWGVQPYDAGHERRHRRHRHLRHHPQRARPGRRRDRGLPARHPGRDGPPLRVARRAPPRTRPRWPTSAARARRSCRCRCPTRPRPDADRTRDDRQPRADRGALVKGAEVQEAYTSRGVGSRRAAAPPASTTASR